MGTQKPRRSGAPAKKAPRAPSNTKNPAAGGQPAGRRGKDGASAARRRPPTGEAGSTPAPLPPQDSKAGDRKPAKRAPAAKKAPSPRKSPKPGAATQPASGLKAPSAEHVNWIPGDDLSPDRWTCHCGDAFPNHAWDCEHATPEQKANFAKHRRKLQGVPDPECGLHPRVKAFADEYLRDLNGTAAYLRIHPTASVRTAGTESWRLLKNPEVRRYVDAKRQRIALSIDFSREDWLREQLAVVLADPSELTQMRCVACADCWPKEREPATPEEAKRKRDDEKGRLRYDDWLEPDPECMTCHGEGSPRVWFADTRKLSPAAKALFLSAYKTKDGIRIELRDKDAALERLGRALGVYEKDNEQKGKGAAEALRDLFSGLHQQARLKAVREEPQAKPAAPSGNPLVRG